MNLTPAKMVACARMNFSTSPVAAPEAGEESRVRWTRVGTPVNPFPACMEVRAQTVSLTSAACAPRDAEARHVLLMRVVTLVALTHAVLGATDVWMASLPTHVSVVQDTEVETVISSHAPLAAA